jgi:iron complex outermembrane receptor protein
MTPTFPRNAVGVAVLVFFAGAAQAQALPEVTVTGNPLGATDLIAPTVNLSGDALLFRSQTTLGETLNGLPGVSSTYFGPNASRPIVRGQDGDRIRILQNGGSSLDASALSFDHAVPVDALVTERIEVLRGPSALQYGGSAVGGVVNAIDNRIPTEPIEGFGGRADLGLASGNKEKGGGVLLEGGNGRFAIHADAFYRETDDVKVPLALACSKPGAPLLQSRICNSASRSDGGALGGTLFFDQGYIGLAASTFRSQYGTVAEDDVTIDMRSNRYALEGEWRPAGGFFSALRGKLSHADYRHTEFDGPEVGTVFTNKGNDHRLEARHRPLGGFEGVIGLQNESSRFSADGEEAFAPHSRTRTTALFLHEELPTSWGRLSLGARTERVRVESLGSPDPGITRFAVGERSFSPKSAAAGALVNLNSQWSLTGNLAYTERAPKDYELFANGPHVATAAWELGDPTLAKEKSVGFDIGAQWRSGPDNAKVNVYVSRFRNYIGLAATGNRRGSEGEVNPEPIVAEDGTVLLPQTLDEFAYRGVRARFRGVEASGNLRLLGKDGFGRLDDAATLDLEWRGDLVRATNTDTGEPLPRIAPARVGATLAWGGGPWGARIGFDHYAAQRRVPPVSQRETDAYTLWNAAITYRTKFERANLLWYVRVDNIGNALAYSATSILTTTAFPKAPLPGRSFKLGLRATF